MVFLYRCVRFLLCIFPSREEKAFGLELVTDLVSCSKPSLLGGLNSVSRKSEGGGDPHLDDNCKFTIRKAFQNVQMYLASCKLREYTSP